MSKAVYHAMSSVKKFGGDISTWLDIHNFFDSSKSVIADNRHRALLHTSFAIQPGGIMERIFGTYVVVPKQNTDMDEFTRLAGAIEAHEQAITTLREQQAAIGRVVPTRDVFEQHVAEDMNFIPTAQDFLGLMKYEPWMEGMRRGLPPSHPNYGKERRTRVVSFD